MSRGFFSVGCARCRSYEPFEVFDALSRAVDLTGGLKEVPSGVLIKANLLSPSDPSKAVTTHPEVLRAACRIIDLDGRHEIEIADNPGYIFRDQEEELLRKTGMTSLQKEGIASTGLLSRRGFKEVAVRDGVSLRTARVAKAIVEAAFVLNVCKLKTHVETEISGSIKNMFGIADTDTRKKAHGVKDQKHLLNSIIDLFSVRIPDYCILDAVEGMEGNGPSRGKPVKTGWIAVSKNALALDVVQAVIMGFKDPFEIPLLKVATRRLPGPVEFRQIDLRGAKWDELPVRGFQRASCSIRMVPAFLRGIAHRLVDLYPLFESDACTSCGICQKVCPVNAIRLDSSGQPVIEGEKCVRCLCCHEMCPTGAMKVGESLLIQLMQRKSAP